MATTSDESAFAEKLRYWRETRRFGVLSPGHAASTRTTVARHDHTGERVGTHTEHWDGRIDATAEKVAVTVNPALKPKESPRG